MKKDYSFSKIGEILKRKTSPAPVMLFILYYFASKLSKNNTNESLDIFGWLAIAFLFSSLLLFAIQLCLGLYHVLTGKVGNQDIMIDRNLPDDPHKKTSFLPLVLIMIGFLCLIASYFIDLPYHQLSWLEKGFFWGAFLLLPAGLIWVIFNFLLGVYTLISDSVKKATRKND